MIEIKSISNQAIIDCLVKYYDLRVVELTYLPLGADMNASVYKARTHDNLSYFVKLKRGIQHDIGPIIIKLLHDAGIQQIIPILLTIQGQPTQLLDDFTLTVFSFIEGQDGFTCKLTKEQWFMLGTVMKKIHSIDVPPSIHNKIRQESYSPKWREAVKSLCDYITSEPSGDDVALKLLAFMKKHRTAIQRLVDRAEQLAEQIKAQQSILVLCHSDLHAGNVLMDKSGALYIVDWDEPIMAPKERDLMFIGGGVANVWNKSCEEEIFYKGYGKTEINMSLLAYYRYERIVEDIAIYGHQLLFTTEGGRGRIESLKQFMAQFEDQGVVEIAFKTDDGLRYTNSKSSNDTY